MIEPFGAVENCAVKTQNGSVAFRKLNLNADVVGRVEAGINEGVDELPLVVFLARLPVDIANGCGRPHFTIHGDDTLCCGGHSVVFVKLSFRL